MSIIITHVEAMPGYKLYVTFHKHGLKVFNVAPYLEKGVFKELKNAQYFKKVRVIRGGIEWPHEQDLSAETLYHRSVPIKRK